MRGKTASVRETPFGQWLHEARSKRGLTMVSLAERAGVSHARIVQLEKGGMPSRDMVERLAQALAHDDDDENTFQRLMNAGMRAAFPRPEDEEQAVPTPRDLTRSIIRQKGFDEQEFSGQEVDQIQSGVEALIEGYLSRKRQDRGEAE